jgi:predicted metalloendopeptidase
LGPYKYFQFNYAPFNLSITSSEEELQQQSQQEILDSNIKFGSGHCLSFTSELMKFTIARLLASKYFIKLNTPKEKIKEIVDNVKNEFILTLKNNEWMDSHTKNVSLDKVTLIICLSFSS